ncbi:MAG: hypothetical protein P8Y91_12400, partial [Desulfuromonadales bacterium]
HYRPAGGAAKNLFVSSIPLIFKEKMMSLHEACLLDIEFSETVAEIDPGRIKLLHLLVDGDRLKVETRVGIVGGDGGVFVESLFAAPVTTEQLGKFLSIAHIPREGVDQFAVFVNRLRNLPFGEKLLRTCNEFVFIGQGFSLSRWQLQISHQSLM